MQLTILRSWRIVPSYNTSTCEIYTNSCRY